MMRLFLNIYVHKCTFFKEILDFVLLHFASTFGFPDTMTAFILTFPTNHFECEDSNSTLSKMKR